jgi:hypothetical protein
MSWRPLTGNIEIMVQPKRNPGQAIGPDFFVLKTMESGRAVRVFRGSPHPAFR